MPISTRRRLEYARGYLMLDLLKEAAAELNAIPRDDRKSVDVRRVRLDLEMESKRWNRVILSAQNLSTSLPKDEGVWIAWAFALHELKRTQEAQDVLLRAEPLHGAHCAVLHYNLACYACMLGNLPEARRRLGLAFDMDPQWRTAASDDPDLQALQGEIAKL